MIQGWPRCALTGIVALAVGLTACKLHVPGGGGDAGTSTDAAVGPDAALTDATVGPDAAPADATVGPDAGPPFTCTPVATTSPVLDGVLTFDPADPHPGDTVTVIVRSQSLGRAEAPPLELTATSASGDRVWPTNARAGGDALYYYALSDVELGDYCLVGRVSGNDEISGKFTVTPRPAPPTRCSGGIYKVTQNHQLTCAEQPEFGNEINIRVLDAQGQGVNGAVVRIGWPNTVVRPIYNDTDPPNPSDIPATVTTGSDGWFHGWNYWPISENGYMVFNLSVDGCASDVATEITTGWWESDNQGCRYCDPSFANRNVWGHWSYTVVFQLDLAATQACVVDNDHAGQGSGCEVMHIHHDPSHAACYAVP